VKRILYLFVVAVCFFMFFSITHAAPTPQPVDPNKHVLIINSYHKGYQWTDNTLAGIESVLKDGKSNIELHVEFMDSKRVVDKNHFYRLFLYYRSKFDQVKFNLIIVSDNDAFNFVLRYRDALFPNIPVVFCGVNALNEMLQQKVPLLTGVVEDYDIKATLEVALKLHPQTKEIIAVSNGTLVGAAKRQFFNDAMAATGKNLKGTIIDDPILSDFERLIKERSKDCIILLLGSFKDKSGTTLPVEESTPVLARYDVPLYGVLEYYLGYGIIGGKLISGYHQGALAGQMGLKILQGEPVDRVPIERKSPNLYMFDYTQMVKFGINQGGLPEGSVVINKPKTQPKQNNINNKMVWAAIAVFICLGIIVVLITLIFRSRRSAEESLEKLSVDLEKRVEARSEELMRSNAELRTKIAEMKHTEASLTESQLKHWTLFQQAPNPVFIVDEEARYSDCNSKMLEFFECTLDELRAMDARELVPGNLLAQLLESSESPFPTRTFEAQCMAHGTTKTLLLNLVPLVFSGKRFVYGVGQEITELKHGQDLLKARDELLKQVIDILPGAVMISNRQGTVEYLSEGFIRAFGFTPDDVPSMDVWWQKAYSEKTLRDSISGAWSHAAAAKEVTDEIIQAFETKVTTKDGLSLEKELRFVPIHDMVVMIFQDMRERKLPETQAPTSRNHESIETLAAGIAHDFNNLLLVILGNISLAKTNLTHEDWVFDRLIDAERASMMTKDLIQQLITFSKGGELSKRAMVITPLIMEVTHSTLGSTNIKGKYIMSDDLYPVEIDEGQIRQVMHIILGNAREAMPQGGTVTISFENVRITRGDYLPLNDGDYVKISLQDEGLGIKKEHLERIFDPYFTTKDVGSQKGVGLGLAIAYSIIKKHSGHIAVESSVGGGTTFHIYLPAYGKEVVTDREVVEAHDEILKKKGKILVMDDAKAVRDVTGAMLSYIGYDVEFARDGREAIGLYREAKQSDEPFDAVILDFTVQGGMGGKEAIQLLLALDPQIRAIISSGYSGDPIMSEYQVYGFKTAILKPYKMEELEEILERLIRDPD
jgi:two-component system cell cycle sensor histidine kinase/response regulator CckA